MFKSTTDSGGSVEGERLANLQRYEGHKHRQGPTVMKRSALDHLLDETRGQRAINSLRDRRRSARSSVNAHASFSIIREAFPETLENIFESCQ